MKMVEERSHYFTCCDFPSLELQKSDPRWRRLSKCLYALNGKMYGVAPFVLVPNDIWDQFTGTDLCAILTYDRQQVTEQMNAKQSVIELELDIIINPDPCWTNEIVVASVTEVCRARNYVSVFNDGHCTITVPITPCRPVQTPLNHPCPVCLDTAMDGDWIQTPCGHQFHASCINAWTKQIPVATCPLCRTCL